MSKSFDVYFKKLAERVQRGDAREESFYRPLADFIESWEEGIESKKVHVTTNPSKTEGGNPDFRVWDGKQKITGYIEAKFPGKNLDRIEKSEQLQRYRETFPNLILTDFLKFRLYRDGELIKDTQLSHENKLKNGAELQANNTDKVQDLLETFFSFSLPRSFSSKELALNLARRTRLLRNIVQEQLEAEIDADEGDLLGFYEAFQTYLIASLEPHDFADLYAQTLTYGLFVARSRAKGEFTRQIAADYIPNSIGILHEVFEYISYGEIPEALAWILDDITEVLAVAEIKDIFPQQPEEKREAHSTVFHFYETFLDEYDPEERRQRGVYYTPEPVVSYIVRSLQKLLKDHYEKQDGLASKDVTLLEPAAGTMTFVAQAYQKAIEEFTDKYGQGAVKSFIQDHLLEDFFAFELMMAPYAIGHLKMSSLLQEYDYQLNEGERVPFYLTNTLEVDELDQTQLPGLKTLAKESQKAGKVKKETPIMVILGNPPYSGHSANNGEWITELIEDYKEVDGEPLNERNPKYLQDDYVKFIRFAQWKVEQVDHAVVGMITNHSWLNNSTFRGMRWQLLQTFDEIRVLDLHGNSLKKETTPEGEKDENVFDIRMGVGIWFFIKHEESNDKLANVYHAEKWGLREEKYDWLADRDVFSTEWTEVIPKPEFFVYKPRNEGDQNRYKDFTQLTDIFNKNSTAITTHRDDFVIDFDKDALVQRIQKFRDPNLSNDEVRERFNLSDNRDWSMAEKRQKVQADDNWQNKITRLLYRAFDERWIFYHKHAIDFGREEVMQHMLMGENLALLVNKQVRGVDSFQHALVSTLPSDLHALETAYASLYHFPLYLFTEPEEFQLDYSEKHNGRRPNLSPKLLTKLKQEYGEKPSPEEIFYYIYAILYAPSYRDKYVDFLSTDFPRIPFTADSSLFEEYTKLGHQLVDLHLLNADSLDTPTIKFKGEGDNKVVRRKAQGFRYEKGEERKYINKSQYFVPIPNDLWTYEVGGYQVLNKWLKDRKGRRLELNEIRTYCKIATALQETIKIQKEIDVLYPEIEREYLS